MSHVVTCPKCGQPAAYVQGRVHCKTCPDERQQPAPQPAAQRPALPSQRPAQRPHPAHATAPAYQPAPTYQSTPTYQSNSVQQPAPTFAPAPKPPASQFPSRITAVLDSPFGVGFKFGLGFCCAALVFSILYTIACMLIFAAFMGGLAGLGAAAAAR